MECKQCNEVLTGKQTMYCSALCKVQHGRNGNTNGNTGPTVTATVTEANPLLNYGPYMDADELASHQRKHKLPKYHNRVPVPGDVDYVGVVVSI